MRRTRTGARPTPAAPTATAGWTCSSPTRSTRRPRDGLRFGTEVRRDHGRKANEEARRGRAEAPPLRAPRHRARRDLRDARPRLRQGRRPTRLRRRCELEPGFGPSRQRDAHLVRALPLDEGAILYLSRLPRLHGDPFDRALVCQAIAAGMTIATPDADIRRHPVPTFWQGRARSPDPTLERRSHVARRPPRSW